MTDFVVGFLGCGAFLGVLAWYAHGVIKEFGWRGLLIKVALFIVGFFLAFPLAVHRMPWDAVRHHAPFVGNPACCVLCGLFWNYLLVDEWPMKWLLKPAVECVLYCAATLVIAGSYAGAKGWL